MSNFFIFILYLENCSCEILKNFQQKNELLLFIVLLYSIIYYKASIKWSQYLSRLISYTIATHCSDANRHMVWVTSSIYCWQFNLFNSEQKNVSIFSLQIKDSKVSIGYKWHFQIIFPFHFVAFPAQHVPPITIDRIKY